MRLSRLARWDVAGLLAGLESGAIANRGYLYVGGTFSPIDVPGALSTSPQGIKQLSEGQ